MNQNQRNESDEDLLFVLPAPLSYAKLTVTCYTTITAMGDTGITLEAHSCSSELT